MRKNSFTANGKRQGAAAVEAALCIPLVFLLTILTLAICSDIYLKETLTVAAFEGARAGVRRRSTPDFSKTQAENVLLARGIVNGVVTVSPSSFEGLSALDPITITVVAPIANNSFFGLNAINPSRFASAKVVMVREFDN